MNFNKKWKSLNGVNIINIKANIAKQDWENFTYYCKNTNITKSQVLSMIINNFLTKYSVYYKIKEDFNPNLSNYKHQQFEFKQDYSEGTICKSIRVYDFIWKYYTKFCEINGYDVQGLLNVIINIFLYPDFPSIEVNENEKQEEENFKYVYNEDGTLKYKTNRNIKGNQA